MVFRMLKIVVLAICLVSLTNINVFAKPMDDLLYQGVRQDNMEKIQLALDNGANINYIPDSYSESPLHVAIDNKNVELFVFLVNKGALMDVGTKGNGKNGRTELIHAVEVDSLPIVQLLLEQTKEKVNATNNYGSTSLHKALSSYSSRAFILEMVNYLISKNANVNQADNSGTTPLMMIANSNGNIEENMLIAKALLAAGADPAKRDNNGTTAIQIAIRRGDMNMINLLLPISPKP